MAQVVAGVGVAGLVSGVAFALALASGSQAPDVVKAPVRVVRVPWGVIGYRVVGRGWPLVLLNGMEESLDDWSPALLDDLGRGARVCTIDYEGVGRSSLNPRLARGHVAGLLDSGGRLSTTSCDRLSDRGDP